MAGTAVHHRGQGKPGSPGPRGPSRGDLVLALEKKSSAISDPVEKLKFIRRALADYEATDRRLQELPSPLRALAEKVTRIDQVRPFLNTNPNGAAVPSKGNPEDGPRPSRTAISLPAAAILAVCALGAAGYQASRPVVTEPPRPLASSAQPTVAESLTALPVGVSPSHIWLVAKSEEWELYSNGLRVDTTHATTGDPRRYRIFDAKTGMQETVRDKPVGIVFHTSESDIWPLEESFNEKLRDSSQGLLRYLSRNRVYNYLIDRFGQVFRVVQDTDKANHAGQGVWTQGDQVFLSLNNAFLGVSFETRWEGGRALPITQAQLEAGRSLTDYLRTHWEIAPDMCVPHGLISLNPRKHLIGHHLDWARGFPFAAFGLPNQYERVAPTVALFGLGYDEQLTSVLGEPWPGVIEAERRLALEAGERGTTVAEVRKERQERFDTWLAEQTRDQEQAEARASARSAGAKVHSAGPNRIGG